MHAHPFVRHLRLAAILVAGVVAAQAAGASEIPTKQGQISYTTGTAPVHVDRGLQAPPIEVVDADGNPYAGRWQVASVDASVRGTPTPTITFRPATLELPASGRLEADALSTERVASSRNPEASRSHEPGFWAPALSTLALAVFFFLRRLS